MQRIVVWFFAFFMILGTGLDQAEAKRLGGGKSFGSYSKSATSRNSKSSDNSAFNNSTQPSKTNGTASNSRSSKMGFLGPLAGLAAGGLLAAMFFGDGFDGFQMLDFILIALVVFILFKLMARKRQASSVTGAAYKRSSHDQERSFDTNLMGGGKSSITDSMPDWFDARGFVERAKGHFIHLQKAWDNNDLAEIQDFVTPELYNMLAQERKAQTEEPRTEVVSLEARLGGFSQQGSLAEASVVFSGETRENSSEPTAFQETWHLVRDLRQENANWYLQGIQQNH